MDILEIFIGLSFVYVLLSLFASILQELISSIFSLRGRILIHALSKLLEFEEIEERILFKRYLRHENSAYKKLISHNLWIKRFPSYLSRDQLVSILQEMLVAKESLRKRYLKKIAPEGGFQPVNITNIELENKIKDELMPKSEDANLRYIPLSDGQSPNLKWDKKDIIFWRWIYISLAKPISQWIRRKNSNTYFIARNLGVIDYKINNINQTKLRNAIEELRREIDPHERSLESDLTKSKEDLFVIYDDFMNRAHGWFKRRIQVHLIFIGFFMAFFSNADTISLFKKLQNDPLARTEVVKLAEVFVENDGITSYELTEEDAQNIQRIQSKLTKLLDQEISGVRPLLGLGWDYDNINASIKKRSQMTENYLFGLYNVIAYPFRLIYEVSDEIDVSEESFKWIGFLLTALAISLGANFWFDLLKLLINIRNTGKRPEKLSGNTPISDGMTPSSTVIGGKGTIIIREESGGNEKIVG